MIILCKLLSVCALVLIVTAALVTAANLSAPGIPNFQQVNDHVWRGGQPTGEGWKSLTNLGVKTVIDLRREGESGEHSIEGEAQAVRAAGMSYVSIPMMGAPAAPTQDQIAKALNALGSGSPIFLHCKEGKDRTGTAIACYRIAHEGWNKEKALEEAKRYGLHWYEIGMKAYVQSFDPDTVAHSAEPAIATRAAQ